MCSCQSTLNMAIGKIENKVIFSKQLITKLIDNKQLVAPVIVTRYNSVCRANQELVRIHNDAAHEELVGYPKALFTCRLVG